MEGAEEIEMLPDDEADRRFEIGLRACIGFPPRNDEEQEVRRDIYQRNSPMNGKR